MAPQVSKKVVKKAGKLHKSVRAVDKKKRNRRREISFDRYIYKILKLVHPDTGISRKAVSKMNSFLNDIFERIAAKSSRIASSNNTSIISKREIETAVCPLLSGELAKHAISEGSKAVTKYNRSFLRIDFRPTRSRETKQRKKPKSSE